MTSSLTRSDCVRRLFSRRRLPSHAAAAATRSGMAVAIEEARAVDEARIRGATGAEGYRHPSSDVWLAAAQVAGITIWLIAAPPSDVRAIALLACVIAHAVASSIEFEIGPGLVVPTTPVLVVALFLVPPQLVPVVAVAGTLLASALARLRDRTRHDRLPILIGSAVHAVGPALVFFVAGVSVPRASDWPIFVLAGLAQLAFDLASSLFLGCYRLGLPMRSLVSPLGFAYFVDVLLFPVGYAIAFVAPGSPAALLLLAPVLLLLVVLQRDRTRELDRAILLATHDSLTGLPNRVLFHERLDDRLTLTRSIAVLLIDLDRFKEVNDTLGHALGDDLLVEVGRRLSRQFSSPSVVARLGGDEFAVLMDGVDQGQAVQRVDELLEQIRQPFAIAGLDVDIDASIGVAMANESDLAAADLLRRADVAMYTAKDDRAGFAFYSAERDHYSAERLALAGRLRQGIADGELVLHYQPQIDLTTGVVVGVEALVRWEHPTLGMIPPDDFIPLAERTELIRPLTAFVFRAAVAQAAKWRRDGRELRVSINLSPCNLREDDLIDSLTRLLAAEGLPASALVIELTETTVMANQSRAAEIMRKLRATGVKISIDDFGTGHSSLSYLTTLPTDELKIDRSFVQAMSTDPNAEIIVRAIIDLARSLGLDVVAEGVETEAIAEALRRNGCTKAQGFLFGRPLPADRLTAGLVREPTAAVSRV